MDCAKKDGSADWSCRKLRINVDNLSVWTPEEKSWLRRVTKAKMTVLNGVSVCIGQGEFIAVLGPSGAGKTTFLSAVAGKCALPSAGSVRVNGKDVRTQKGVAELVPQFDVFMNAMTVMEHLIFMTEMKLGSWKKIGNRTLVDTLIKDLKLATHKHTTISSLSGGERRLLSLASTLLSNPEIIICDEPTTGLDTVNASLVVGILKQLASSGKIVITSVHQPSSDLFKEFNSLMLMAEGRLIFYGTQEDCQKLFESIGLRCPKNYNPAEFYIRAVSNTDTKNYVDRILEKYKKRLHSYEEEVVESPAHQMVFQRNWFIQVYLLLWRSSLTVKRRLGEHIFQLLVNIIISATVICACYVGISGTTQRGIQDMRGFLWLLSSDVSYSLSYSALYAFEADITLFRREVGIYKGSAFFTSRLLTFIPRCIAWPISYACIASLAVDLPNQPITTLEITLALMCGAVAAAAYGLGMSALFTSTGITGEVVPCTDLPLSIMAGAFLRISSLPMWLLPVKYISHFYYTMDAVSNIYWRQIPHIGNFQRNWFIQVYLLLWRSSLTVKRRLGEHIFQLLVNIIISATVICACYVGISGTTQRGIQDMRGFLWLLSSDVSYSLSYSALYAFEADITLFRREVGIYKGSAFFTSRLLTFIPRCIAWPISYACIASLAVDLPNQPITTLEITLALMCGAVAAAAYGLGMSALFTSTGITGEVVPCTDLPLSIMAGAFLRISSLPMWLLPVKYISHFYYTMDAVSNIYWRQIPHIDCPANSTSTCVSDGISVLMEAGYSTNFMLQDGLGLILVTLLWSFLGYYGLRREEKKGYAY